MSFDFKIRGQEYIFEKGDYFRWEWKKREPRPTIHYVDKNELDRLASLGLSYQIKQMPRVAWDEWKRIMRLEVLQFIPDKKDPNLKRFYLKD